MRIRRSTVLVAGAAAAAMALAACGGSGGSSSDSSSGGVPANASSQVIRVAIDALPASKGNPFTSVGTPGIYTYSAIYDPLTFVDKEGTVKPWLATSWKNTGTLTWTFALRSGVKFSNGETLDAQGAADVINFVKTNPDVNKASVANDLANIVSAKVVDASTIEVTTAAADPLLPNKMSELFVPAPKALTTGGIAAMAEKPIGSGPFQVSSWAANKITLSAFNDSWRKPIVGGMEIQALPDPASRMQALQSGQVDLITAISPDQSKQLSGKYSADITKAAQVMSLAFINTKGDSPLTNVKVRQALNFAVDKDAIAKSLLLGQGEAVGQGAVPGAAGYNASIKPYAYDTAKAKQLLTEAGYPNGFKMSADVVVGSFPADAEVYQSMKADLLKVGVDITLNQVTFATWLAAYSANSWTGQAFGLSWNSLPTMDGARTMGLFSCLKKPAFFCDQPIADALTKASTNLDLKARDSQLQDVAKSMYDNPPALYLIRQVDINGKSTDLQGFVNNLRFFPYDKMYKKS